MRAILIASLMTLAIPAVSAENEGNLRNSLTLVLCYLKMSETHYFLKTT